MLEKQTVADKLMLFIDETPIVGLTDHIWRQHEKLTYLVTIPTERSKEIIALLERDESPQKFQIAGRTFEASILEFWPLKETATHQLIMLTFNFRGTL